MKQLLLCYVRARRRACAEVPVSTVGSDDGAALGGGGALGCKLGATVGNHVCGVGAGTGSRVGTEVGTPLGPWLSLGAMLG